MSWNLLDGEGNFVGVFQADDYTPCPLAIFTSRKDADAWIKQQHLIGDIAVCEIRHLNGVVWNSYDPVPAVAPTAQELEDS